MWFAASQPIRLLVSARAYQLANSVFFSQQINTSRVYQPNQRTGRVLFWSVLFLRWGQLIFQISGSLVQVDPPQFLTAQLLHSSSRRPWSEHTWQLLHSFIHALRCILECKHSSMYYIKPLSRQSFNHPGKQRKYTQLIELQKRAHRTNQNPRCRASSHFQPLPHLLLSTVASC